MNKKETSNMKLGKLLFNETQQARFDGKKPLISKSYNHYIQPLCNVNVSNTSRVGNK